MITKNHFLHVIYNELNKIRLIFTDKKWFTWQREMQTIFCKTRGFHM